MNIAKNTCKVLTLLVVAMLCMAMLAACGGSADSSVSEIFVQRSDMPRQNYILGQDLDFSKGVLTAVVDGQTTPIPLSSPEVTYSGYNKDQLGKQTITITYKGKTTTIDVMVSNRISAEGYEENFFIGDSFDNSKGKLKVTMDDGSVVSVNMNSDMVTVKSFDSSKSGKGTVTVTYTNEGVSYDCSFEVNVHEVASITLTNPKKTKYASHETELALGGGYLTVQAPSPSTFSKYVNLTADMISGYDPSVLTYETRDQVVTQTLTVTYAGHQASFDVEISYGNVQLLNHIAGYLNHLDWTQATAPELTQEEKDNAITAMRAYLALTPVEKEYIAEETKMVVLFPAAVALREAYINEILTFENAFGLTSDGRLFMTVKTYADVLEATNRLQDPDDLLNVYAAAQLQMKEEFGDVAFLTGKIQDMVIAHSDDTTRALVDIFTYLMKVYDTLEVVPTNWTIESLAEYEVPISSAASRILMSDYKGMDYNSMLLQMSKWRENDDVFDIIYAYYCYAKDGGHEDISTRLWQNIPMPGLLNSWYMNFMRAIAEEQFMMNYESSNAYLYDTVAFMYYYSAVEHYAAQIMVGDSQLQKDIYAALNCDLLTNNNLRSGPRGYLYHMSGALDSVAVRETWNRYLDLVDVYLTVSSDKYNEHAEVFTNLFDRLVDMSPSELYSFLSSVNFLYSSSRGNVLVLDVTQRSYSTMTTLLAMYYSTLLPEEVTLLYCDLMLAMENHALVPYKESAMGDFKACIEKMQKAYAELSAENKAIFDTHLGEGYSKYLSIYSRINDKTPADLGQWEVKMEQLLNSLLKCDEVLAYINNPEIDAMERSATMPVYLALYEKCSSLYNELRGAGAQVEEELYIRYYEIGGGSYTLEQYFYAVRGIFGNFMVASGVTTDQGMSYMLWDLYGEQGAIRNVMRLMADLLLAEFDGQIYTGENLSEIMLSVRALSPEMMNNFFILGINQKYYAALERLFQSKVSGAGELIRALMYAEINYGVYAYHQNDETLATFNLNIQEMMGYYEQLEDKAAFDACLGEMYQYYLDKYNALQNQ